ncbi:MAG TPA: hypothetical protein VGA87_02455 [Pyrinomonadaceae bacterium]
MSKKHRVALTLITLLFMVPDSSDAQRKPPRVYVDKGACEGEGCASSGHLRATAETILYALPDERSRKIGTIRAGAEVVVLASEVHVVPGKFVVKRPHGRYKVGDIIRVYTYHGEGIFKVRYKGRWNENESLNFSPWGGSAGRRCELGLECWGELEEALDSVTWIKIKSAEGRIGWTNQPAHFD